MTWPQIGERQWVTIGTFGFAGVLLGMAAFNPALWEVEVFKVIIQAVVLTGLLNMVLAFHFASNKGSETARENTGKAFDAMTATADAAKAATEANAPPSSSTTTSTTTTAQGSAGPKPDPAKPQEVVVVNKPDERVPVDNKPKEGKQNG